MDEQRTLWVSGDVDRRHGALVAVGDLDMATCSRFEAAAGAVLRDGVNVLALDLHRVGFIDSSGLRCLLGIIRVCERRRVRLELLPSGAIIRMFELCQITDDATTDAAQPELVDDLLVDAAETRTARRGWMWRRARRALAGAE